jgi:BMFP domain-containing protein YqiC
MTTMIQQEVKQMFAEVIQQVRTELTSALKDVKQQMLATIREQIHNDITAIREQITLDIQTQVRASTKETMDSTIQAIVHRNRSQSLPRSKDPSTITASKK